MARNSQSGIDPTRYRNKESARSAASAYKRRGNLDAYNAIREHWGIGTGKRGAGRARQGASNPEAEASGPEAGTEPGTEAEGPEGSGAEEVIFEVADQEVLDLESEPEAAPEPLKPMTRAEAGDLAALFILMLNTVAVAVTGTEQARMKPYEKELIHDPLQNMLIKHVKAARHLATVSDPVALILGLAMWGKRVAGLRQPAPRPQIVRPDVRPDSKPGKAPQVAGEVIPGRDAKVVPMTPELLETMFPNQGMI